MLPHHRGQAGFTLIELIVVISLIGLFMTMSVPLFGVSANQMRLKNAANLLSADIRLTQQLAQKQGKRARVMLDPSAVGYQVQIANTETTSDSCDATDFTTVKNVVLQSDFTVLIKNSTFSCFTFEPTGRTAWANPKVLKTLTDVADPNSKPIWVLYLNGVEAPLNTAVISAPQVNTWTNPTGNTVTITLDLGQQRLLDQACIQVIRDGVTDFVAVPESIRMDWSTVNGSTPPSSTDWQAMDTQTPKYKGTINSPDFDWSRACPPFVLNRSVRYIRFVSVPAAQFDPDNPDNPFIMALDEIKIPAPSITLQNTNGRNAKKISITPVTGRVSVN